MFPFLYILASLSSIPGNSHPKLFLKPTKPGPSSLSFSSPFPSFKMDRLPLLWLMLLSVMPFASSLYFHIAETERKCFIEEIPDETMVIGEKSLLPDVTL